MPIIFCNAHDRRVDTDKPTEHVVDGTECQLEDWEIDYARKTSLV